MNYPKALPLLAVGLLLGGGGAIAWQVAAQSPSSQSHTTVSQNATGEDAQDQAKKTAEDKMGTKEQTHDQSDGDGEQADDASPAATK